MLEVENRLANNKFCSRWYILESESRYLRDGSSETGVFCCISLLLERLKAEHRIDVFQTVRSLQQNRPLMFKRLVKFFGIC